MPKLSRSPNEVGIRKLRAVGQDVARRDDAPGAFLPVGALARAQRLGGFARVGRRHRQTGIARGVVIGRARAVIVDAVARNVETARMNVRRAVVAVAIRERQPIAVVVDPVPVLAGAGVRPTGRARPIVLRAARAGGVLLAGLGPCRAGGEVVELGIARAGARCDDEDCRNQPMETKTALHDAGLPPLAGPAMPHRASLRHLGARIFLEARLRKSASPNQ